MGRPKTGGAYASRGKFYARPMVGGARKIVALPAVATIEAARERAALIATAVADLEKHKHTGRIDVLAAELGAALAEEVPLVLSVIARVCSGEVKEVGQLPAAGVPTISEMNEAWVSGDLHRRFPDYVKLKRSSRDDGWRFNRHIKPHVGAIKVDEFTRDHAKFVMAELPENLEPITRRHVAQQLNRLLTMAVWPLEIIPHNPIPRGFLPRVTKSKTSPYLYPDEEAQLLGCKDVPLQRRVLYALLSREGMRKEEGAALEWSHIDLKRGTITLEKHKTSDEVGARFWVLDPSTVEMLRRWRTMRPKNESVFSFRTKGIRQINHLAEYFRKDLGTAGVIRTELFTATKGRLKLRAHDTRAGFCTLSLAMGRSEDWCTDRTGHTDTKMLRRYKRAARSAKELNLGWWHPAHEAIPEIAKVVLASGKKNSGDGPPSGAGGDTKNTAETSGETANSAPRQSAKMEQVRQLNDRVAVVANPEGNDPLTQPTAASATPSQPVSEGVLATDGDPLRRALTAAVERGDLAAARVLLDELERLEAAAATQRRFAPVVSIDDARRKR
jgi:integrase